MAKSTPVKTDIVKIISRYFNLKREGDHFTSLCPFHQESNPSFKVFPKTQTYQCFGCNSHGDAFDFVMNYEKVDRHTAALMLARKV